MDEYYTYIQQHGNLITTDHAQRWSRAILQTLGMHLSRGAKKKLASALPEELANDLTDIFWLAHFRDKGATGRAFQKEVARRAGNSDPEFARKPILAVFNRLKNQYADSALRQDVADSLSPQLREMWEKS